MTDNQRNIVLIGFMASGKSRIGEMLAKQLGFPLIDIDDIIEHDQGMSIREIFLHKGEAYFRALEKKALEDLSEANHAVIVTGGGSTVFFDNAESLKQLGHIFFLDASFAVITKRLARSSKRPLGKIDSHDDLLTLKNLYLFRRPIYARLGHNIDVNHENKTEIVDDIIERFNALEKLKSAKKIVINDMDQSYPIFLHASSLLDIGSIIASLGLKHHRPVIVTSDRLAKFARLH